MTIEGQWIGADVDLSQVQDRVVDAGEKTPIWFGGMGNFQRTVRLQLGQKVKIVVVPVKDDELPPQGS